MTWTNRNKPTNELTTNRKQPRLKFNQVKFNTKKLIIIFLAYSVRNASLSRVDQKESCEILLSVKLSEFSVIIEYFRK